MRRERQPPIWEQEAPLTPRRAAEILRKVQITYVALVALFWSAGVVALILLHNAVVEVAYAAVAVLNTATMYWAYRNARAAISRNTTAPDQVDVGL